MTLLQKAHRAAKLFCGTSNLNTFCLEASVVMVEYLHRHGHPHAHLIRRNCDGDGHWTIQLNKVEYDPTCADWPDPPPDSIPRTLYQVTQESPHHAWPRTRVNMQAAYEITGIAPRTFQKHRPTRGTKIVSISKMKKATVRLN
jgi:hypothetical protein